MAYGDYLGPNKHDKGQEHGSCNRTLCQASPALWYNHGSLKWYCGDCRNDIETSNKAIWAQMNKDHPMFETREMIDQRKAK